MPPRDLNPSAEHPDDGVGAGIVADRFRDVTVGVRVTVQDPAEEAAYRDR